MSRGSVARATLMGRMGADIHTRQVGDYIKGELSIAVNHGYGDKGTTSWFNVIVWNKRVIDQLKEFAGKGALLFVEGELMIRKYQVSGADRWATEIIVGFDGLIEIIQRPPDAGTPQREDQPRGTAGNRGPQGQRPDDLDDDVPF